jgi:P-type conjugative transfer ATPase TrbB
MPLSDVENRRLSALRRALGPIVSEALSAKNVVEIMLNPDGVLWLDKVGEGRVNTGKVMSASDAEQVIRLIASSINEEAKTDNPIIAAVLPQTGERFQGVLPPVSDRPMFTIRKRPELIFTLDQYVESGTMTEAQAEILRQAVKDHKNVLVAGGTGSGKTTLSNAILAEPQFTEDRILIIEDTPELQCSATDKICLLTRNKDPKITMQDLVKTALRLRPDRIPIGEIRDGSALDMLKAWNTGHPGGLATIHANSAVDALYRLEDLIGESTQTIPYRAIAAAINVIVYIERTKEGRKIKTVAEILGRENNEYIIRELS